MTGGEGAPPPAPAAPPLEQRPFWNNVSYLVGLLVGLIAIATAVVTVLKSCGGDPKRVFQNTEIVVDRSAEMNAPFGAETKLAAAIESVARYVRPRDADNLALRSFGGTCGETTSLDVRFGQRNASRILDVLGSLNADGEATLANAVIEATGDFNDPDRFGKGLSKRIVVVTGGGDSCTANPEELIRERLHEKKGEKLELDFRFIGVGLTPTEQAAFKKIADATGGQVFFAQTTRELNGVLRFVLETEPVVKDIRSLKDIVSGTVTDIQGVIDNLNAQDYDRAGERVEKADRDFEETALPFRDLATRQSRPEFRRIFELASKDRGAQQQLLSLTSQLVDAGKKLEDGGSKALSEYNAIVEKANRLTGTHNSYVAQLDKELAALEATLNPESDRSSP